MAARDFNDISGMNFEPTHEQMQFLTKVKQACEDIRASEEKCYLEQVRNESIVPVFFPVGMMGCPISTKYGGLGYDMLTYCLALEEIGRIGSSLRTFFSAHTSIGQLVLQSWGDESQRSRFLPSTTSGENIMAFALTEPAAGSDPASLVTRYERSGRGFVINGRKHWIGNGTFAGLMTTYAKNPESGKISAFIVERPESGGEPKSLETEEIREKLGLSTVMNADIRFRDFEVPAENLLGTEGQGLSIAFSALIDGRLSVAAGAIGVMRDCLSECIEYSKGREQHGSPLAKKQLIQDHLARIATGIESSRWLVYRAAAAVQALHKYVENARGEDQGSEWRAMLTRGNSEYAALRANADYLASVAKFHASNCSFDAANRAVQVFGSAAYTKKARVARHFVDSRATIIYEGANEVLELKIASALLGPQYGAY